MAESGVWVGFDFDFVFFVLKCLLDVCVYPVGSPWNLDSHFQNG